MIYVHVYDIERTMKVFDENQRQRMLSLVCISRKQTVDKITLKDKSNKRLLAGYLLERTLREYAVQMANPIEAMEFIVEENGKPVLNGRQDIFFNMSHSGNMVVIAVGDTAMGVDVELTDTCTEKVAKRFFHANEWEYIESYKGNKKPLLARCWTMKEAYIKYTGEGLKKPLDSFETVIDSGDIIGKEELIEHFIDVKKEYTCSLCCDRTEEFKVFYHNEVVVPQ